MEYNLEKRTREFSKTILRLLKHLKINELNRNIISQLIKSATSVGANYCETNAASSKKDFTNKIFICRKEIQETKYWIEMLGEVEEKFKTQLRTIWQEAHKLTLIFNKISSSARGGKLSH